MVHIRRSAPLFAVSLALAGCTDSVDLGVLTITSATTSGGDTGGSSSGGDSGPVTSSAPEPTTSSTSSTGEPATSAPVDEPSTGDPAQTTGPATTETTITPDTSTSTGDDVSTGTSTTGDDSSSSGEPPDGTTGIPAGCGDNVVQPGEDCDDGSNDALDDGCLPDCQFGEGALDGVVEIPAPVGAEDLRCMAPLPNWGLDIHGMAIGRAVPDFGPDGQSAAETFGVLVPWGGGAATLMLESAGVHGRVPLHATRSAGSNDTLTVGLVDTEPQMPGSGGHLWLGASGYNGELFFLHDFPALEISATDLRANGFDSVVVGNATVGAGDGRAVRFDALGEPFWEHTAPAGAGWSTRYRGAVLDPDGVLYIVGERHADDGSSDEVSLEAFAPDGSPLWAISEPSPTHAHAVPSGLALTNAGALVVAMTQFDVDVATDGELGVAAFTTAGDPSWWNSWTPPPGWSLRSGAMTPYALGGVFIGAGEHMGDLSRTRFIKVDDTGTIEWATHSPGGDVLDIEEGPTLHVFLLTKNAVTRHYPW